MRHRLALLALAALCAASLVAVSSAAQPKLTLKKFSIPGGGVSHVVAGPGGIWFSALQPKQAGRLTVAGKVKQFALPIQALDNSAAGNNIVLGPDGKVWVTGQTGAASVLVRVTPAGKAKVVDLGMPTAPGKDAVAALGVRKGGPFFFGVWWNRAGRIGADGALLPDVNAGNGLPAAAIGWAADRGGAMWFVYGRGYGRIAGDAVTTWEPTDGHKHDFRDIALGPDGNMWVTDNNNAEKLGVGRIKPDSSLKEFKVPGGPWSIAAGPDGNLWVSLPYIGLGRVTPKGKVTVYKDVGPNPTAVTSGFGRLWLVTDNNGAIARIDVPAR